MRIDPCVRRGGAKYDLKSLYVRAHPSRLGSPTPSRRTSRGPRVLYTVHHRWSQRTHSRELTRGRVVRRAVDSTGTRDPTRSETAPPTGGASVHAIFLATSSPSHALGASTIFFDVLHHRSHARKQHVDHLDLEQQPQAEPARASFSREGQAQQRGTKTTHAPGARALTATACARRAVSGHTRQRRALSCWYSPVSHQYAPGRRRRAQVAPPFVNFASGRTQPRAPNPAALARSEPSAQSAALTRMNRARRPERNLGPSEGDTAGLPNIPGHRSWRR